MKRYLLLTAVSIATLASWALFVYAWHAVHQPIVMPELRAYPHAVQIIPEDLYVPVDAVLPSVKARIATAVAKVTAQSPGVFAYAHGTVAADGRIFIGMAGTGGNPFPADQLIAFGDPSDISHPIVESLRVPGEIDTMVYDPVNDKIYFDLSNNGGLHLFIMDPHSYAISAIVSSTTLDAGRRPAIVTDGTYIYGITNTEPSIVFKAKILGGDLTVSRRGHIPNGHSAAIGIFGSSTELYFGGDMSDGFEKVDAATLDTMASTTVAPCSISDDMPFVKTSDIGGYVYMGCETVRYGVRLNTTDMSFDRFQLPGASLGLFVYGNDLYNAAQDGYIDVFPNSDLTDLHRYKLIDTVTPFATNGQDIEPNEILYSPQTAGLYFTAWLGVEGLYQISTSSSSGL